MLLMLFFIVLILSYIHITLNSYDNHETDEYNRSHEIMKVIIISFQPLTSEEAF